MGVRRAAGIILCLGAWTSNVAWGADNADLNVSAQMVAGCAFNAATYVMNFGNLNPSSAVNVTVNTTIQIICTSGVSYTLSNIAGARTMAGYGTALGDNLNYSIAPYATTGIGTGAYTNLVLSGTVLSTQYHWSVGRLAGPYQETITISVTP